MKDMYAPVPFDPGQLYPSGLPVIHPVPATYRAGAAHFSRHLLDAVTRLHDQVTADPDADAEIDALVARVSDAWFSLQRTGIFYRTLRDVKGWA